MRILVVGTGVIGTTYAWQLHKAGYYTTHLVRKHKLEACKAEGIRINCLDMRKPGGAVLKERYLPTFVDDFPVTNGYDYILVAVNSNQLADLLPELSAKAGKATIVFLQNMRLGDDTLVEQHLDRSRYVIAYPFKAGGGSAGNTINAVIFGLPLAETVIGEVDGRVTGRVRTLHAMLKKANMNPRVIPDIIPYIRTHYIWAACSVAAYAKAGTYERFNRADSLREAYVAMREGWEICVRQGINPRKVIPTRFFYLPFPLLVPATKWLYGQKGMREMFEGHVQHSPGEVRDMYFTLLAEGEKLNVAMPTYGGYQKYIEAYLDGK